MMIKSEGWRKWLVSPQNLRRSKQRKGILKRLWKSHEKSNKKPQNQANMWSTENSRFCEKYIEKQPKTSQNNLFSAVFWSKWQDSNLRSHRPERCAIPPSLHLEMVKLLDFFCKWSNMWSDRGIDDFSTFGRAEKVSVFKGFRLFSKNLRRAWWLSPETGALPTALHLEGIDER